jgi:hypothetical protein
MSRFGKIYERIRSLIIWLGLGELVWIGSWLLNSGDRTTGYMATAVVWLALMLAWMALVIFLGNRGVFLKHTRWLSNLVGFALVLALPAVLFGAIDVAREGLVLAASHTSNLQLASFHVLRLLAIGTVIKYIQGQLPLHFVIFGSVPDLLFASSAVVITILQATTPLGRDFLIVWHIVGFFVFFGAGISMFFSVPSPFRIYHDEPDSSLVFQFPMLLAPNFTVPLFALAHGFALVKLFFA